MKNKNKKKDKRLYLTLILIILLILILRGKIIIPLLIAMSLGLSYIINNFPVKSLGLELTTFIGVIIAKIYGPVPGLIAGGVLVAFHLFASGYIGLYVVWTIPAYAIGCAIGGMMPANIVTTGIIVTFLINITEIIMTLIFTPDFLVKNLPFWVTNVVFNVFLFTVFGEIVMVVL